MLLSRALLLGHHGHMKKAGQWVILALCAGFSVAAVVNVFGDNAEVEAAAKAVACEGLSVKPIPKTAPPGTKPSACVMTVTKMSRTPFGQSFEMTGGGVERHIRCSRAFVLVGAYACAPE